MNAVGMAWHALPVEAALDELGTDAVGIDAEEAVRRLERYGPNGA